jgi:ribosomal protein S18 acetylase RimI-like enzyme
LSLLTPEFRRATEQDIDFLYRVYASTRQEEVEQTPWTPRQRQEFLAMQAEAQNEHYRKYFPDADYFIIVVKGEKAGRLYISRSREEIRIVDIALLPDFRGAGLGERILQGILQEAHQKDIPVRIHVEKNNPALRLYQRLNFRACEDKGVYWLMEHQPDSFTRMLNTDS